MSFRSWLRHGLSSLVGSYAQMRVIPVWQAGRPLPAPRDYTQLAEEGYRRNVLVAACIWEIATSASEPDLVVKRRKADGTLELATGPDAENLRALLHTPNPEDDIFTLLEQAFIFQHITGNWFMRKVRAEPGNVVQLAGLRPDKVKVIPLANGYVGGYAYEGLKDTLPAEDVIHCKLHPDPLDDFYGMSPIVSCARFLDLDNKAADYLRAFFTNNATPAGILKLKGRADPEDRKRIKEIWKQDHTGSAGWESISVLDSDADWETIGAKPERMKMDALWKQSESRICMAFGVPPSLVGAAVGINPTYSNYREARHSFWQETLTTLYKRTARRLTRGLCPEFSRDKSGHSDLVIEFDLSRVEALQESQDAKHNRAVEQWNARLITLDQALEMVGQPPAADPVAGASRKAPARDDEDTGLAALLAAALRPREQHARVITPLEKRAASRIKKLMTAHFAAQGRALVSHLED